VIKKLGVVTVGVAAGLVVAAPFASATESHHGSGHGHGHDSGSCNVVGGEAEANGGIHGDSVLGNALLQAPVGGNNALNIVCNDVLNGNLSGNDVAVAIGGDAAPGLPELPPLELPGGAA
jgi:hypothetical protein